MALDISKLARMHDFYIETKALGKIKCGSTNSNSMSALGAVLKAQDVDGPYFARKLICVVGKKLTVDEVDGEGEIQEIVVTAEDVEQLSEEEIELFAKEFISHNSWLIQTNNDTGTGIRKSKSGESDNCQKENAQRSNDEKSSGYLMRIFEEHIKNMNKRLQEIINPSHGYLKSLQEIVNPFGGLQKSMFENSTLEALRRNFDLSDHLRGTISQINRNTHDFGATKGMIEPIHARFPEIQIPENPAHETNRRLNGVIEKLESVQDLAAQSAEIIRNMNDTALMMQSDYIRNAKRSEVFTKAAIWIAAISLFVTCVFSCINYFDSKSQSEQAMILHEEIRSITSAQKQGQAAIVNAINKSDRFSTQKPQAQK